MKTLQTVTEAYITSIFEGTYAPSGIFCYLSKEYVCYIFKAFAIMIKHASLEMARKIRGRDNV